MSSGFDHFPVQFHAFQFDELNSQVASSTETLQVSRTEINDLKRTLQSLQIELQSQQSLVIQISVVISPRSIILTCCAL